MIRFCVLLLLISSQAWAKESLSQYIKQVEEANPALQTARLAIEKAQFQVRPASTWEDPFIAAGVDEIPFEGGMGSVKRYQISQTIPFPGKASAKSAIAGYEADTLKSDSETTARQIRVLATQVYFKAFLNQQAIHLNKELRGLLQTIADSAKSRYQSGTMGHHEWLLSQVELNILEVERLRLLREQRSLTAIFNELRNKPVHTTMSELSFEYKEPSDSVSDTPDLSGQPEYRSLDLILKQASEEERLAKLSYFPDLVLQGMMMEPSPDMMDQQKNWGVMLGISVPIYFWRKQSDLVQAASIQRKIAENQRQTLTNRIATEWLEAQEQLKTSKDVVKLYQTAVLPSTRLAVQNARTSYTARKLSLDQYLDTLKIQRVQEIELLAAQMDVQLSDLRLKNLLSSPPLIRLSPSRPSLFGGAGMGTDSGMSGMGSSTVNMGSGMSGPTRNKKSGRSTNNGSSGMEGM